MKNEELTKKFLIEMFKRVGLDYNYEQILEYAKQDDWYWLKSWTEEEEQSFIDWVESELKGEPWNAKTRQLFIAYFQLMYGWKRSEP